MSVRSLATAGESIIRGLIATANREKPGVGVFRPISDQLSKLARKALGVDSRGRGTNQAARDVDALVANVREQSNAARRMNQRRDSTTITLPDAPGSRPRRGVNYQYGVTGSDGSFRVINSREAMSANQLAEYARGQRQADSTLDTEYTGRHGRPILPANTPPAKQTKYEVLYAKAF